MRFRGALSSEEAAALLLKRKRCRDSLVGFAQNIIIPSAPIVGGVVGSGTGDGETANSDTSNSDTANSETANSDIDGSKIDDMLLQPVGTGLAAHHILMMDQLQRTMMTPYGRIMIMMPPGAAKSTYGSVVAPTWYMGKFPASQIILGSYNTALAKKHGSRGRNIVQQGMFIGAFNCTISSDTQAKELWSLTNGSEYMSGGLQSGLTGNRADGLIIDDPVRGRADAKSETVQRKTIDAYEDDAMTRLKPGAWVCLIQTRWDPNDLAGMILPADWAGESGMIACRDGMDWLVLNIPAKCKHADDPLGRKIGEYLWPEWFDAKHWRQYEPRPGDPNSPNQRRWDSLYQQEPRPETGNEFEEQWVQWYKLGQHPNHLMLYSSSDYAVTDPKDGDDPDFTEHAIGGLDENGHLWLVDWYFARATTNYTIKALVDMCKRWNVRQGFGEPGIIRRAIEAQFEMVQRDSRYYLSISYLPHIGDKVARFADAKALGAAGRIHIPDCPWGHRLVKQLCVFPSPGVKDDAVDALSLLARGTRDMVWSPAKVTKPKNKGLVFGSWEWITSGTEPKLIIPGQTSNQWK